jgi:SAM-dependent methyltransferase
MSLRDNIKGIYHAVVPKRLREVIYKWRHPELRLELRLSAVSRGAIEKFLDSLAAEGVLKGRVLEIGAGGRHHNQRRFEPSASHYWRSDIIPWPNSKLDLRCDITNMPLPDGALDAVICSEVLEHLPELHQAVRELGRIVKPDGLVVLTMPFFYPLHGVNAQGYGDFWRLTPANIRAIFKDQFSVVREQTSHLFYSGDAFVVGVQLLLKRSELPPALPQGRSPRGGQ